MNIKPKKTKKQKEEEIIDLYLKEVKYPKKKKIIL